MIDQAMGTRPLSAFAAPFASPTVVRLADADAVVLTSTRGSDVEVWTNGAVVVRAADTSVTPVTDPVQAEAVLHQAVLALNAQRREALESLSEVVASHATTLSAIRGYAIQAHRDGDICEDGLNEFLRSFGMDEYEPAVRLSYTMAGLFIVVGTDEESVRAAAAAVAPDHSGMRPPKEDTHRYQASVTNVRSVALHDGRSGFEVGFAIAGEYETQHRDADDATADCVHYLRPNLTGVSDVFPSSMNFTFTELDSRLVY